MSLENHTSSPPAKRKLLIPHKRGLLPVSCCSLHKQTTLNPSTRPAGIQFRRPVFSSVGGNEEDPKDKKGNGDGHEQQSRGGKEVVRIEFDSSQAPQPFLEPDVLERIRERHMQRQREKDEQEARQGARVSAADGPGAGLNAEREIRRRAVQTEYGSMAVRGRMAVSGRGRRR